MEFELTRDLSKNFKEVNKDEWSDRLQYYLAEFHTKFIKDENSNK